MDPDKLLADIRDAIGGSDYIRACELFEALDEWLGCGGFFPAAWRILIVVTHEPLPLHTPN